MEGFNPQHFFWRDPDGLLWEFNYIVTHTEAEGPEYLEHRCIGQFGMSGALKWEDPLPPMKRLPDELENDLGEECLKAMNNHFFGTVISDASPS